MFVKGKIWFDSRTTWALRSYEKPHKTLQPPTSRKTKKPSGINFNYSRTPPTPSPSFLPFAKRAKKTWIPLSVKPLPPNITCISCSSLVL